MRNVLVLALVAISGCVGGHIANEVVVDPLQAEARDVVDGRTPTPPTRQHDVEAAFHACSTLTARLEGDTESEWAD